MVNIALCVLSCPTMLADSSLVWDTWWFIWQQNTPAKLRAA